MENGFDPYVFPPTVSRWARPTLRSGFHDFKRFIALMDREEKGEPRKVGDKTVGHVSDDNNFAYNFDLSGFEAKDIKVKTIGQKVVVEAETEQKEGCHSFCHRHFRSSVMLPKNVNSDDFKSILNNKGVLSITAPLQEYRDLLEKEVLVQREERQNEEPTICEDFH